MGRLHPTLGARGMGCTDREEPFLLLWGQTADAENSVREGRGSGTTVLLWEGGRKSSPTHLYGSSRGALTPSSRCCQHHLQVHSLSQNPSPQKHTGLPGWVWCEAVVPTLSPSQLGKGLLESTLSSQQQGGKSPTPGAVRNHHKHPGSGPGRQQVCGQAAGMQAGTPVCAKAALRSDNPLPRHTRNSSRAPASILSTCSGKQQDPP